MVNWKLVPENEPPLKTGPVGSRPVKNRYPAGMFVLLMLPTFVESNGGQGQFPKFDGLFE